MRRQIVKKICDIIVCRSLNFSQNSSKFKANVGLNELYKCSKFERNRSMGRLFLCDLNIFVILCEEEEEEKCEENRAIFRNKYLKNY